MAGATESWDDPVMGSIGARNWKTVWYRFRAPGEGEVRAHTRGSNYDTVLAIFTGSRGNLSLVADNDDADWPSVQASETSFPVHRDIMYYVEVGMYSSGDGTELVLSVEFTTATATPTSYPTTGPALGAAAVASPRPPNDDIASATGIYSFPFSASLDTAGATTAADDPQMGSGEGANSHTVWYRLAATTGGTIRANTLGSGYDTVLAVFSGSRGNLTLLQVSDDTTDSQQSQLQFPARAGTVYYIEVAAWGTSPGGAMRLTVESNDVVPERAGASTPPSTLSGAPRVLVPAPVKQTGTVARDARYFPETGFRVNQDGIWDYFQKRGGVRTFGYPISWEFPFLGFEVQFFQRAILQKMPGGGVTTMNLLDEGLMPYGQINFSTFPEADPELWSDAPSPLDSDYGEKVFAFLQRNVPNQWEGLDVRFLEAYLSTVRFEDAFPDGNGEPALLPLLNLEMWGLPTSNPAPDPANGGFVYQRFQRGILHHDAATGATQPLLMADYLKSIITGQSLPADLDLQARPSRFYRQLSQGKPGALARPEELPGTNLEGAFEPAMPVQAGTQGSMETDPSTASPG